MSQVNNTPLRGPRQHHAETRRDILLPMLGAGVLILALVAIAAVVLTPAIRLSLLADYLFTLFVLCPTVICIFPIVLLLTASVYGLNRMHQSVNRLLMGIEDKSQTMTNKTTAAGESLNQRVVELNARLEPLMKLIDVFERSDNNQGDGDDTDNAE